MTALLPLLLIPAALYLWIKRPRRARASENAPFPWRQLLLALSGTLGVGNITGVATAGLLGGRGSVLWMLVSALLALILKDAEGRVCRRSGSALGMVGALAPLPLGRPLSRLWAACALLLSLSMGAALQTRAIASAAVGVCRLSPLAIAAAVTVLVALLIRRADGVMRHLGVMLPVASALYIAMCLAVILRHRAAVPALLGGIVRDAFCPQSVGGGLLGTLVSEGMRRGFAVGLLSNEAGAGTSTLAQNEHTPPIFAGAVGRLEVVFDTLVLCPLSALTLLLGADAAVREPGGYLRSAFARTLSPLALWPLFFAILLFALSTVLCWYLYGTRLFSFFNKKKKGSGWFRLPFLACVFLGALMPELLLVSVSDTLLFFLSCMTVYALVLYTSTGK